MQDNTIQNRTNPFFVPYNTPHDTVPFERIRLEDYEPAFMEGIRRDDEATDKIVTIRQNRPLRIPLQELIPIRANTITTS